MDQTLRPCEDSSPPTQGNQCHLQQVVGGAPQITPPCLNLQFPEGLSHPEPGCCWLGKLAMQADVGVLPIPNIFSRGLGEGGTYLPPRKTHIQS